MQNICVYPSFYSANILLLPAEILCIIRASRTAPMQAAKKKHPSRGASFSGVQP
jgi:hypothetical protein